MTCTNTNISVVCSKVKCQHFTLVTESCLEVSKQSFELMDTREQRSRGHRNHLVVLLWGTRISKSSTTENTAFTFSRYLAFDQSKLATRDAMTEYIESKRKN